MHGERVNLSPERGALTESTHFVGRAVAAPAADIDGRGQSRWWELNLAGEEV